MKRTTTITTAALLLLALPALAADPQPAPTQKPLDPKLAMAAIASLEADQHVSDIQADLARQAKQEQIQAIRAQCGAACAATEAPKP